MRSLSVGAVSTITKAPPEPVEEEEEEALPPVCDFCQNGPDSNAIGEYEELLFCRDCAARGKDEHQTPVVRN